MEGTTQRNQRVTTAYARLTRGRRALQVENPKIGPQAATSREMLGSRLAELNADKWRHAYDRRWPPSIDQGSKLGLEAQTSNQTNSSLVHQRYDALGKAVPVRYGLGAMFRYRNCAPE